MKSFHRTYQSRDFIEDFEGVCEIEELSTIYKLLNYEKYFQEKEMYKKTVSGMMMTLLFIGMFSLAIGVKPAKSTWTGGTIYIRADGSIDPPDAPIITYDNVTYTLTDNITSSADGIVVERDNIILDGGGYTVQGVGAYMSKGIYLTERINVTIKNTKIQNFYIGIRLDGSLNNVVTGNNIANNHVGINLFLSSDNNIIVGNNIKENSERGIMLNGHCLNNIISGNNLINNGWDGITLWSDSNNNTVSANMFYGSGLIVGYSYNNVIVDNVVNGKPLVYLENISNVTVQSAGQVILVKCSDIQVRNLNLSHTNVGIQLWETSNTVISENNITANRYGIRFDFSFNNNISRNNIEGNWRGIKFWYSSNNMFFHNNFVSNTQQVDSDYSTNTWDDGYPSGGNYWDDYSGVDYYSGPYQNETGSDGIGDTPYVIDENNVDRYPLMEPWAQIVVDAVPPRIGVPQQSPSPDNVIEYQEVWVSVNVTDAESGVKNVTLRYSIDGGDTWYAIVMTYDAVTGLYQAVIPGYPACTTVAYMIVAYDNAENIAIQDNNGYYYTYHVRQYPSLISSTIDLNPKSLNLRSRGKWITGYIELPEGYDVSDINVSSILLNDTITVDLSAPIAVGDHDEDGVPDLMVKFDRANVISYVLANVNKTKLFEERFMRVALTMTGYLNDGTLFQGTTTIRVLMPIPFFDSRHWRYWRTLQIFPI